MMSKAGVAVKLAAKGMQAVNDELTAGNASIGTNTQVQFSGGKQIVEHRQTGKIQVEVTGSGVKDMDKKERNKFSEDVADKIAGNQITWDKTQLRQEIRRK